jgi:hypothetical protein
MQRKKKVEKILLKEKDKRTKHLYYRDKIRVLMNNEHVKMIFNEFFTKLDLIFNFYRNHSELNPNIKYDMRHLQLKGYYFFCFQFFLFNDLLSLEEIQLIYRSATNDLKLYERYAIGFINNFFFE